MPLKEEVLTSAVTGAVDYALSWGEYLSSEIKNNPVQLDLERRGNYYLVLRKWSITSLAVYESKWKLILNDFMTDEITKS